MARPERIVDLHAHLFNARCVPLASIIAHAMDKDSHPIATALAWLLQLMTESEYEEPVPPPRPLSRKRAEGYFIGQLCEVAVFELRAASGALGGAAVGSRGLDMIHRSRLLAALRELDRVIAAADGARPSVPARFGTFAELSTWARRTVRAGVQRTTAEMDPGAWGGEENYPEFFFNMLRAEAHMAVQLERSYGRYAASMRVVHHMMDMQMAYHGHEEPYYPFFPVQLDRMQVVQRNSGGRILGFSAFDPRRDDWRERAERAWSAGFAGFKFYPAMEYKPYGNDDPRIEANVQAFFGFCIDRDAPVFTHCTAEGFQTRHRRGLYAHPKHWKRLLESGDGLEKLRLCFGHGGGGVTQNVDCETGERVVSHGWMADEEQWKSDDNFAKLVAGLCRAYENVYCDLAYITELLDPDRKQAARNLETLKRNLKSAADGPGDYPFTSKVMYGSDWHMPSMVDNTARYLEIFLKLCDKGCLDERFFWRNAYDFLRLA